MKSICFIPARGGSKGIPRKNLRILGDKPLIAHSIEIAKKSRLFEHIIVSTDDKEIKKIALQYGAEVPFMRPKYLATDKATFDDVLLHGIHTLLNLEYEFDTVLSKDCTVPFIDFKDMKNVLNLLKNSKADSVFSVKKAHPSPYFGLFEENNKGFLIPSKVFKIPIKRRQDAPIVYEVTGVYANDVKKLLKSKKMFSSKILPYEISMEHAWTIDFEIQFKIAEFLYQQKLN